jgi:cytochrome P450
LLRPEIVHNPTHHETIRGPLTRNLAGLVPDILDEVRLAFDEVLGTDTKEFKEAVVFDTVIEVVARASNRVFIGVPLCRNKKLLAIAMKWAQLMPMSASLLNQFPRFLHPVFAPVVTFLNHWYARKYVKIVSPEIRRRQELSRSGKGVKPNDLLQWTVDLAEKSPLDTERDVSTIALRLLVVNFAAIHTSTFSVTNTVIDLICSDPSNVLQIREEIQHALEVNGGNWDKGVLQHLIRLDSSMRESSRLGSFLGFGITRKIIAPDGIVAPNGTTCPYGTTVAVPTNGIHNDPALYEDAAEFKPFRFVEMRETAAVADVETHPEAKKSTTHLINNAKLSFVSLSSQYHPFGYGRHACPGRFFAANELKLLLAYMFQNYEFENQPERPPYKWIGTTLLPPMTHKVKFRRIGKVEKV